MTNLIAPVAAMLLAAAALFPAHARAGPGDAAAVTTFTTTIRAAGLADTLARPGRYTVFAPTDAAFDKLPAGTVATLLKPENKAVLTALLAYHIVPGTLTAKDLRAAIARGAGKASLATLQGEPVTASVAGDRIILTDAHGGTSQLSGTDRPSASGILHTIDTVLMP
ncbi:MAG TPA: fasciclin domain-containing protein [Sphingomonadaceae bacterium]|nr:fasciclin domain-containing protein [Sphingomonadaceae bacterium]